MSNEPDLELRILSQPRYLCVVRAALETALDKLGFDEETAGHVAMSVDEALANVIRHGYQGRSDGPITVRLTPTENGGRPSMRITIDDETPPVDPQSFQGRQPKDPLTPGGLGVNIIHQLMDDVSYSQRPEGGMRLVMAKTAAPRISDSEHARKGQAHE